VLDPSGERVAGDADLDTWREAVAESVASGHCVPTPRGYVAAATAGSEHVSTVVIEGPPLSSAEQRTLERGALVTALVVLLARTVAEAEERIGGELLRDLLSPTPYDAALVRERARRHGAQLDGPLVVAVAGPAEGDRPATTRAAARLADTLHGVAGEHEGAVVLVVPEGDARGVGDQLAAAVTRAGAAATVGVAGPAPAAEVAVTYGEARGCLETLLTLGRVGEVTDPAGLGVARLLLGANGPGQLAEFVDRELGPVAAYDAQRGTSLVATLDAWFASGGSLKDTAAALHVHPNTVTQRLERVTGLLGETWRAPERALDLQLALRVARLQA
jgi:sugar diacid utilization regulator